MKKLIPRPGPFNSERDKEELGDRIIWIYVKDIDPQGWTTGVQVDRFSCFNVFFDPIPSETTDRLIKVKGRLDDDFKFYVEKIVNNEPISASSAKWLWMAPKEMRKMIDKQVEKQMNVGIT